MRIPFISKKKTAKVVVQPRLPDGTFGSPSQPAPRLEAIKTAQNEFSFLGNAAQALQEINKLAQLQDTAIQERAEALAFEGDGLSIGNEWIPVLDKILPAILPYLPGLIEKYAGVAPSPQVSPLPPSPSASEPESTEREDIVFWINRAAKAGPNLIKPFIPTLNAEIAKRGLEPEEFKKAIQNLSKAYGGKE